MELEQKIEELQTEIKEQRGRQEGEFEVIVVIDAHSCSIYNLMTREPEILWYGFKIGRRGALMVSVLHSGSNGPSSSPGWGTALCSRARHL